MTIALAVIAFGLPFVSSAQDDDIFAFIPAGGRTLLEDLIVAGTSDKDLTAIVTAGRSTAEWEAYLKQQTGAIPALGDFDDYQTRTLAQYVAATMPLEGGEAMARDQLPAALPMDGRDMTLQYCQSCHIVTVVVTQDRPKAAWLGTMNKPSHIEIKLTPAQRSLLADYLVTNGGIPIDLVPEELRAGGASY
jgi:mono/diheme cytochrome c family protein